MMIPPSFIINLKNFSSDPVPYNELLQKFWTPQMIALLGKCDVKARTGTKLYALSRINDLIQNNVEFRAMMIKKVDEALAERGGCLMITDEHLREGCQSLYDLNKHIKQKSFTASTVKRAYELKATFIRHLYEYGYAQTVVFEQDTNQYRFTFVVNNTTFIWHQPKGTVKYIGECPVMTSDPQIDRPISNADAMAVMRHFERVILSIVREKMNEGTTVLCSPRHV